MAGANCSHRLKSSSSRKGLGPAIMIDHIDRNSDVLPDKRAR
jgi:hypothetical protein